MNNWDQGVVVGLHSLVSAWPPLETLATILANGGPLLLLGFVGLAICWPGDKVYARRRAGLVAIVGLAVGLALTFGLEHLLARPRPFVALGIAPLFPHAADSSFPSDHTLLGVTLSAPFLGASRRLGLGLVLLALLIGLARVAAAVHYPSDVLGSALLGLGLVAGSNAVLARATSRLPAPVDQWLGEPRDAASNARW